MALVRPQLTKGPGVYLQEVPSGVHTIIGVPTSVTAFLGRTSWGSVGEPATLGSFDDFQTQFGGLSSDSYLGYTVQDFFLNGGTTAIIVRLCTADAKTAMGIPAKDPSVKTPATPASTSAASSSAPAAAAAPPVPVDLEASSPGTWGNNLTYWTTKVTSPLAIQRFKTADWDATDLFNLTITLALPDGTTQTETFANVSKSIKAGGRYINVVLAQSRFVQYSPMPLTKAAGTDSAALTITEYDAGIAALKHVDIFNLVCIPPDDVTNAGDTDKEAISHALAACSDAKATLIVDPPKRWNEKTVVGLEPADFADDLNISAGDESARYAAIYYPRVQRPDPFLGGSAREFPACGLIAGVIARTDASRGVWKAPAGFAAGLSGINGLSKKVDDIASGHLNGIGVNCLRSFAASGPVVWGARTARGSDDLSDDYKYLPVRRLADYIETTLMRSTMWAVFEPNDEPLWAQLRLSIGGFMADLFRQGAFQGSSQASAYFVNCDATTTLQSDIDAGIVNVQIGFAPLKPAEFVVLYLSQIAGQGDS
jgi:uncharacterized protein